MKQAKMSKLAAGAFASILLVAACGGAATPAPATEAPASEAASQEAGTVPAPEQTSLKIGLSVTETSQYAAKLAEQLGIFQKYGFEDVEVTVFEGDGKTMQALQAGQLDVGFIGVSSAITSQTTDAPVAITSVNARILSDLLTSIADVKSADDLRGKCVAVSTYGGTSHGAVILSLQALNLTPADVVITEIGGQSARIAALQGGSCAAAPVDAARQEEMAGLGFNFLVDLKKEQKPWGRSGAGFREDWLAEHPNTVLAFQAALLEAQNTMWADPDAAAEKYAEFAQIEPDLAKKLITDFQEIGNRPMTWDKETFENPKTVLSTVNPDVATVNVEDAWDDSFLTKLKEIGFYEKLGVPTE